MAAETSSSSPRVPPTCYFLQKFRLYHTRSKYYMVGRDKSRRHWRVLKIDKSHELSIREDPTTYTEYECSDLLTRINEGNKSTGGLTFLTTCYGIVGFIKFLGPYYMLLITQRSLIGSIGGHPVYAISKTDMIPLSDFLPPPNSTTFQHENRYKKLLGMVDLTKDFFFSYSYHVMRSLQKNNTCCNTQHEEDLYETMFVWNEFLTRGLRNLVQNSTWTVALVYGFFKQDTISVSGREFKLTLISRRSRHYAGTRYLKRGVNDKGRVANDVETEQILFEDVPEPDNDMLLLQMTSVVQNRGSIPLFWSQETSRLNIKPDITLSRKDQNYEATRLHFQNLVNRYGNPIIILNLIKTTERRPRESILRTEFANAIKHINEDLSEENRLKFLHWDLHKHSRSKGKNALLFLSRMTAYALTLTGFFYMPSENNNNNNNLNMNDGDENDKQQQHMFEQQGVLRTNCIDCLDRTNVAQYAYGLSALGHQLHALGAITSSTIDLDDPLAQELMGFYERMGDTLAYQYGGSAAHNKVFSEKRGQWKAATQSQEFFRTLQRYYNNAYVDAEKQNAINVFLGHFEPQDGGPQVWELESDERHVSLNRNGGQSKVDDEDKRSLHKKSLSDGNIIRDSKSIEASSSSSGSNAGKSFACSSSSMLSRSSLEGSKMVSESTPDISAVCEPCSRWKEGFEDDGSFDNDQSDSLDYSNFVDLDWLSSCDEESLGRSFKYTTSEKATNEIVEETTPSTSESSIKESKLTAATDEDDNLEFEEEYSDSFLRWVNHGEALCH